MTLRSREPAVRPGARPVLQTVRAVHGWAVLLALGSTRAPPGSEAKIRVLAFRAYLARPLWVAGDATDWGETVGDDVYQEEGEHWRRDGDAPRNLVKVDVPQARSVEYNRKGGLLGERFVADALRACLATVGPFPLPDDFTEVEGPPA
jgi:hypothetical protein